MWVVATAFAAAAPEEIVVWGDPFARWEQRWLVETEVRFSQHFELFAERNLEISLRALRLRAVLACDVDAVLGAESREVRCTIEDVGLVAQPRFTLDSNQRVLDAADASLTGAVAQLQVRAAGTVPDLDLEGVPADNLRERQRVEQLRQLVSRVTLPFHLQVATPVSTGMRWYEYNSLLFRMPARAEATMAGSEIAHFLDAYDARWFIVQSVGRATLSQGDLSLRADLRSVGYIDQASGILAERRWVLTADHTASSMGDGWSYAGHFRQLGRDERVDVGPTAVARGTWSRKDPNPEWVAMFDLREPLVRAEGRAPSPPTIPCLDACP